MEVEYNILYHKDVVTKDFPKISARSKERIRRAIETKLASQPETFGRPLRRSLKGYRKLRVGSWRVVFKIEKNKIYVLAILHRSIVYKEALRRI